MYVGKVTNATGVKAVMPEHPTQNSITSENNLGRHDEEEEEEEIDSASEVGFHF